MKKTIIIIILCVLVAAIVGIVIFRHGYEGAPSTTGSSSGAGTSTPPPPPQTPATPLVNVASPQSAYDIATTRARQWKPDAALIKIILGDASGTAWTFTFVSPKTKGEGFQVVVNGQTIVSAAQIPFAGGGTVLPTNLIDPNAAIAEVHSLRGYENATIVSLELLYNATAKQWYWGVVTSAGTTVTVNATP